MILLSAPFTRSQLHDLLRAAGINALVAERPELRRLESAIVRVEICLPQTGPYKGGAVIGFTIAEPTHADLPGQKTFFDGETPASADPLKNDSGDLTTPAGFASAPPASCTCQENLINVDGLVVGDVRGCPVHDPRGKKRKRKAVVE